MKSRHRDMFGDKNLHDTRNKTKLYEQNYRNVIFYMSPLNLLENIVKTMNQMKVYLFTEVI